MMRLLPLLPLLAACAPAATDLSRPTYRDPAVLIASKADFDAAEMAGDWQEVARFAGTAGCAGAELQFEAGARTLRRTSRCPDGSVTVSDIAVDPLGRLSTASDGVPRVIWVLWVDTGYRTAVFVSPDGTGGQILNRGADIPGDRLRAALEVLDFNGFDTDALILR